MEKVRITILCENRAHHAKKILGEHGFAALIQTPSDRILLDTGQGMTLAHNADALKIDLSGLDHLALSHGHYDHTGGLGLIPRQPRPLAIHAHPALFSPKYLKPNKEDEPTFIGLGKTREEIEQELNAQFQFHTGFTRIADNVWFSGRIPSNPEFDTTDPRLMVKTPDGLCIDPFEDDAVLLVETGSGPVIVSGCAHSGIVNIMEYLSEQTGHKTFHSIIGGTHLGFMTDDTALTRAMDAFDRFEVQLIAVSHCTGNEAAAALHHRFGQRFAFAGAGWQADF